VTSIAQLAIADRDGAVLSATVGTIFAFRVCLTFLWFQDLPAVGTAATVGLSLTLLIVALVYKSVIWPAPSCLIHTPRTFRWINGYLLLAVASLAWTTTQSVPAALAYWSAMAADVMTVALLLRGNPNAEAVALMKGFVIGAAGVAVIAWCAPVMDDLRLGDDYFLHPNAIGFVFAISALFAFRLAREGSRWKWLGMLVAITLLRTLSKACIVAFLAAAIFYLLHDANISRQAKVKIGVIANAILIGFWGLLESYLDMYAQGSRAETLTGRTFIWAESFAIAVEKPWLGHGFYSFRWVVPPFGDFEAWQAHNEFLQQFFSYGVVGVVVVAILYSVFLLQVRRSANCDLKTLAYALLILALVRGLVDTERFDLSFPLWLMAMFALSLPQGSSTLLPNP
jgi:exopolysaccharide production protein ExoQ